MITPEFLQSCTDEQINKGVAWLEAKKLGLENPCEFMSYDNDLIFKDGEYSFSPCSNPNDAWPIIIENKIDIYFNSDNTNTGIRDGAYKYIDSKTGIPCENKNPLRAAMEVYILMSTAK